jgi:two-component system chemotaxis sensor kinase CheA
LKGAARAVDATAIAVLSHKLEELLISVRDGKRPLTPGLFTLLFAASDALVAAGDRFGRGLTDDPASLAFSERIENALRTGTASEPIPLPTPAPAAPSEPLPQKPQPEPPLEDGLLRVKKRRVERLLGQTGELRTARLRLDARAGELEAFGDQLQRLRAEWVSGRRALTRNMRRRARKVGDAGDGNGGIPRRTERLLERSGGQIQRLEQELGKLIAGFRDDRRAITRAAEPLESEAVGLRMEPFRDATDALMRQARDVALAESKLVDLAIEGDEIEIDRAVLERLKAPLLHLVRNAIDHGIESPAGRKLAGKPERGRVLVRASLRGELVQVEVTDDGRGLDRAAIRAKALAMGMAIDAETEIVRLIFQPGLSTAGRVTEISGRGVGLDVVKTEIEAINGRVEVWSEPGRGTRFVLELPPTLSTSRVLFARAAGEFFALPCSAIQRLIRPEVRSLRLLEGKPVVVGESGPIPVVSLSELLGFGAPTALAPEARLSLVVLSLHGRRAAIAVDELLTQEEILLKPLGPRIKGNRRISSATILPNGRLSLVLNPAELLSLALARPEGASWVEAPLKPETRHRLLLVDDSMTTRTLERNILESAGYDVMAAADGRAALDLLERRGADLVVSDVEMPELDGLGLLAAIRSNARFRALPVILLTALDAPDNRQRGLDAGADAYLVKSAFDQSRLLETIRRLL